MNGVWEEEVRGTIIGDITFPYKFYTKIPRYLRATPEKKWVFLGEGWFVNDAEAIEWLKKEYPDVYANRQDIPIEMRCWDK